MLSGVISLSEPTSSFSPQTQPQPLPLVHFFSGGSLSALSSGAARPAKLWPSRNAVTRPTVSSSPRSQRIVGSLSEVKSDEADRPPGRAGIVEDARRLNQKNSCLAPAPGVRSAGVA